MIRKCHCFNQVQVAKGSYKVEKPLNDWTKFRIQDDSDRPMRGYTLENLDPSTYYEVNVIAENEMGKSEPAPSFVFHTEEGRLFVCSPNL